MAIVNPNSYFIFSNPTPPNNLNLTFVAEPNPTGLRFANWYIVGTSSSVSIAGNKLMFTSVPNPGILDIIFAYYKNA
jgi:hypothetical protein